MQVWLCETSAVIKDITTTHVQSAFLRLNTPPQMIPHVYLSPKSYGALGNTRMLNKLTKVSVNVHSCNQNNKFSRMEIQMATHTVKNIVASHNSTFPWLILVLPVVSLSNHSQILSHSHGEISFLHGCEIKSGGGQGTTLDSISNLSRLSFKACAVIIAQKALLHKVIQCQQSLHVRTEVTL